MPLRALLWNLLGLGVLPAWLAAGGADWLCHRRTRIQQTSGARESALHLLLFIEIAIPAIAALWLEITAAMLLLMAMGVLAHMLTSWMDTAFAQPRRLIAPIEQQVHSWLEMLPLFALVIVATLHTAEFVEPRWTFALREPPLAGGLRWAILLGFAAGAAMIIEEWIRCLRYPRLSAAGPSAPEADRRP